MTVYRLVGVCFAGLGGAGGSVGDVWISCGSTRLQALLAVAALVRRNSAHAVSVSLHSVEPFPISKHHSEDFEGALGCGACAIRIASAGITGHIEFVLLWGRTARKRMRTAPHLANPFRDRPACVILVPVGA